MAAGVDLILYWHMHQPDYRDLNSGEYRLPWVYLHAIKDYADMAAHAEAHPDVRLTFNFVPILLEQLDDYAQQFRTGQFRDPLLRWLVQEDLSTLTASERRRILSDCFRVNEETMLKPFDAYRRLKTWAQFFASASDDDLSYLSAQYFADVLVWHQLSWTGETVRRAHPALVRWMAQGRGFTSADRQALAALLGQLVADLLPRYRRLAERGQIEISTTPYFHPIAPLLISFASAKESWPAVTLPERDDYPGGRARARAHAQQALQVHAAHFGATPHGVWPAEGGVSTESAQLLAESGFAWMATGQAVLANSLRNEKTDSSGPETAYLHTAYRVGADRSIACFFRDDALSDRIGFEYSKWHADDAVPNFVGELVRIARDAPSNTRPLVTIIMDGENAWEYYPFNGYYFISKLYTELQYHESIKTVTPSEWLRDNGASLPKLGALTAGSWVYGTFSTWIGAPAKNRAWEMLCDAKRSYDQMLPRLGANQQQHATRQLAVCEGSDWFWWLGDDNPSESVASFDALFRANLRSLYQTLGVSAPSELDQPLSRGGAAQEAGGVMRRSA